jgi:hypothetical protein
MNTIKTNKNGIKMFESSLGAVKTPAGSILTAMAVKAQMSWAEWGSGLVDALTDIFGLVVVFFLVIHWYRQIFKDKGK